MPAVQLWTYKDLVDHATDYLGSLALADAQRDARRAVLGAYRDLANAAPWTYLYGHGRIVTAASQTSSTVTYTSASRQLTLAAGTWPAWARNGMVRIGTVDYVIAERTSDTVLTLASYACPSSNLAAGTAYTLYRDTYPAPIDFIAVHHLHASSCWLQFVHPREWLADRSLSGGVGTPALYTITGSDDEYGRQAFRFWPAPSNEYTVDFIYQHQPRRLVVDEYKDGLATTVADSTTVTGTNTAWTAAHVGCVLRLAADASNYPTGPFGLNRALYERAVVAVGGAGTLTVDQAIDTTLSSVKYVLSDPADIEEGVMLTPLLRGIERACAQGRTTKNRADADAAYRMAVLEARAADSRNAAPRGIGWVSMYGLEYKHMPLGADRG